MRSLERHVDELGTINLVQTEENNSNSNKERFKQISNHQQKSGKNPYKVSLDLTSKELVAQQEASNPKSTNIVKTPRPQKKKPRKPASPPDEKSKRIVVVQSIDKKHADAHSKQKRRQSQEEEKLAVLNSNRSLCTVGDQEILDKVRKFGIDKILDMKPTDPKSPFAPKNIRISNEPSIRKETAHNLFNNVMADRLRRNWIKHEDFDPKVISDETLQFCKQVVHMKPDQLFGFEAKANIFDKRYHAKNPKKEEQKKMA